MPAESGTLYTSEPKIRFRYDVNPLCTVNPLDAVDTLIATIGTPLYD